MRDFLRIFAVPLRKLYQKLKMIYLTQIDQLLQLIFLLDKDLQVDNQGILTITDNIKANIKDMSWVLPVR